jgi:hypothetical protein
MPVKSQKNVLLQSFFFLLTDFATWNVINPWNWHCKSFQAIGSQSQ